MAKTARRRLWGTSALAAVLGLSAGVARAEIDDGDTIVVVATRTASDQFDVAASTTVITDEEIEAQLASDIKDLIRFEPGVSVRASPSRFSAAFASTGRDGNSGFNIRGLEGNRVLFLVDGVRVPDGFSFGPASFGRGDYVDLDLLRSVEIVPGPASALYGSDGLAGVVSFTTKDPEDMLRGDDVFAARARVAYAGADESWAEGLSAAWRAGPWQAMAAYTRRDGRELQNQGDVNSFDADRTAPNPQDIFSDAAMARLVFAPSAAHRFRLTYEYGDRTIETEAYAARSVSPPPPGVPASTAVIDVDGLDESERSRIALDYYFESAGGLIDRAFVSVYAQQSALRQFSDEDRFTAPDRLRDTTFDNDVWGLAGQTEREFATGAIEHHVVFGGDYSVTRQEGVRDGTVPPTGESFPTRAFPNTDYTLAGIYLQDAISLADGRVTLFPALRYDSYKLEPDPDALYPLMTAGQSDGRVSPRFGVVAWPSDTFGLFATWAEGFKAPAPSQVNNNFANPIFGYTSLPNPGLRPETSETVEIGARLHDVAFAGAEWRASVAVFEGQYEGFIDQVQVSGSFTPMDPAIFQFINLGEVDISGWEARAEGHWRNGFSLTLAASFAEGDQTVAGVTAPVDSVEPWKLVAGLGYNEAEGRYGGQFIVTHSARKQAERACAGCFTPDAFTILDLTGYLRLSEDATLRVGVFNVTDETYWWWGDVRGLSSASATRDAYTQPGRNVSASISYRF